MDENNIISSINKLFNTSTSNYIFIYTPPKVGSTTLVTSLRVSLGKSYNIIHIHDEVMLKVLTGINNIKIVDIIKYLSNQGKNVYVIDVYRTPVERKMSEFFEKIVPYHFNNTAENISKYSINRIIDRFNKIFPHIENGDHYFNCYEIEEPIAFDHNNKCSLQIINNVKYLKLRLCDSNEWQNILSNIFATDIVIIHDYKTEDKDIGSIYKRFKQEYKIPSNYIDLIKKDKYLNFYYSQLERNNYINEWNSKIGEAFTPYSEIEFNFYMNICLENQYINDIDVDHYIDNGCFCKYCSNKRKEIFMKAKSGEKHFDKIIHKEIIKEVKKNKMNMKMKELIQIKNKSGKFKANQFSINLFK